MDRDKMLDSLPSWQQEHWNEPTEDIKQFGIMTSGTLDWIIDTGCHNSRNAGMKNGWGMDMVTNATWHEL